MQWSIDTVVGMDPPAPDGSIYVILMIDTFSKWVEIASVPTKAAEETTKVFHENIICRYGIPTAIRTDRGTEYHGKFSEYCEYIGVK
jgi:hypothetical protein